MMNYRKVIATKAFMKTATLYDMMVAQYEGEDRRKQDQRQDQDRRQEGRGENDRRQEERREPTVRDLQAPHVVIHVKRSGDNTIYDASGNVLATLQPNDNMEKQWDYIEQFKAQGKIDPNAKIYTARIMPTNPSQDFKDAPLFDATNYYNLYISSKSRNK